MEKIAFNVYFNMEEGIFVTPEKRNSIKIEYDEVYCYREDEVLEIFNYAFCCTKENPDKGIEEFANFVSGNNVKSLVYEYASSWIPFSGKVYNIGKIICYIGE